MDFGLTKHPHTWRANPLDRHAAAMLEVIRLCEGNKLKTVGVSRHRVGICRICHEDLARPMRRIPPIHGAQRRNRASARDGTHTPAAPVGPLLRLYLNRIHRWFARMSTVLPA